MAKLNTTVLVFSPNSEELNSLRDALEPVVAKYREAKNYREACQKAQNEPMELYILGYNADKAPVDISDFYYFARESAMNKASPVYVWAPNLDEKFKASKDKKLRFFTRGKFKDLIESLDEFSKTNSIEYITQKTKEGLPFFMRNSITGIKDQFEAQLKHSVQSDDLWKGEAPSKSPMCMSLLRARLVEGVFFVESCHSSVDSQKFLPLIDSAMNQVMISVAEEINLADPQYKIVSLKEDAILQKEFKEGSWKCIELRHGDSSNPLARIFLKIRPNSTPGSV